MFDRIRSKTMAALASISAMLGMQKSRIPGPANVPAQDEVNAALSLWNRIDTPRILSWGKWKYPRKLKPEARRLRQIERGQLTLSNGLVGRVWSADSHGNLIPTPL